MKINLIKLITCLSVLSIGLSACKQSPPAGQSRSAALAMVNIDPSTAGSVSGTVTFEGNAPKAAMIDMTADSACPQQPQPSDAVVIHQDKLANVFVYVKEGLPAGTYLPPATPAELDQKGCRYVPHILGMMAGQQLRVTNSDAADHNVHAMPVSNRPWNESQRAKDPAMIKTFSDPEMMVAIQCNQHPWMKAYINVMANPYFTVSSSDGRFEIGNLPPGEYTLVAVHEKFGERTARIKVVPKENARADFKFATGK